MSTLSEESERKKGKTERRTPARPECEFLKAKQRFREQEKLAAIQFYGCGSKKGPLFDTYAHHSVATEPDQAPGKCRGRSWAIGVTSQRCFFFSGPEIQKRQRAKRCMAVNSRWLFVNVVLTRVYRTVLANWPTHASPQNALFGNNVLLFFFSSHVQLTVWPCGASQQESCWSHW